MVRRKPGPKNLVLQCIGLEPPRSLDTFRICYKAVGVIAIFSIIAALAPIFLYITTRRELLQMIAGTVAVAAQSPMIAVALLIIAVLLTIAMMFDILMVRRINRAVKNAIEKECSEARGGLIDIARKLCESDIRLFKCPEVFIARVGRKYMAVYEENELKEIIAKCIHPAGGIERVLRAVREYYMLLLFLIPLSIALLPIHAASLVSMALATLSIFLGILLEIYTDMVEDLRNAMVKGVDIVKRDIMRRVAVGISLLNREAGEKLLRLAEEGDIESFIASVKQSVREGRRLWRYVEGPLLYIAVYRPHIMGLRFLEKVGGDLQELGRLSI